MLKTAAASAVLALVTLPQAALAQDGAKLDCAANALSAESRTAIGASMTSDEGGDSVSDALLEEVIAVVEKCVKDHKLTPTQADFYFDYTLARVAREWLAKDIARLGLSVAIVDKALDFGPNRANPDLTADITDAQVDKMLAAYTDAGVDVTKIDDSVWEKVGAYAAATSQYWLKRNALKL